MESKHVIGVVRKWAERSGYWIFFWNLEKSDEPKKVGLWKNEQRRLDNLNRDTKKIIRWADARNRLRINGNQKILEDFEKFLDTPFFEGG